MARYTLDVLAAEAAELTAIRRAIHRHPEIAFEEHRTAQIVADKTIEFLEKENLTLRKLVVRLSEIMIRNVTRKKQGRLSWRPLRKTFIAVSILITSPASSWWIKLKIP